RGAGRAGAGPGGVLGKVLASSELAGGFGSGGAAGGGCGASRRGSGRSSGAAGGDSSGGVGSRSVGGAIVAGGGAISGKLPVSLPRSATGSVPLVAERTGSVPLERGSSIVAGALSSAGATGGAMPSRVPAAPARRAGLDRKSTRLNSSHVKISYAVFCLKKKNK